MSTGFCCFIGDSRGTAEHTSDPHAAAVSTPASAAGSPLQSADPQGSCSSSVPVSDSTNSGSPECLTEQLGFHPEHQGKQRLLLLAQATAPRGSPKCQIGHQLHKQARRLRGLLRLAHLAGVLHQL